MANLIRYGGDYVDAIHQGFDLRMSSYYAEKWLPYLLCFCYLWPLIFVMDLSLCFKNDI